ncbi:MAG: ABC transporter permease, partial [Opitutales bacterium]|nr:ABC transporter permease [Opitutales bacterium]
MKASTELDDEMEFHIEMSTQQKVASGIDPKTARKQARREFGQKTSIEESCRMNWGMRLLEDTFRDLKFAFRQILKHRSYSIPVLIILTLCIAFNLTIFDRIESWILKPYDIPEQETLYQIMANWDYRGRMIENPYIKLSIYGQIIQNHELFDSIAFYKRARNFFYYEDYTTDVFGLLVTDGIWDVLKISPAYGRTFSQNDLNSGNGNVCLIDFDFASEIFGDAKEALHQSIRLDAEMYTIIGVLPDSFNYHRYKIWRPLPIDGDLTTNWKNHGVSGYTVFRAKESASSEGIQAVLDRSLENVKNTYTSYGKNLERIRYKLTHKREIDQRDFFKWSLKSILFIMQFLCIILLFIGCANVVSLTIVQINKREQEVLIRSAVGAKRSRIFRQFITELALLFLISGGIGIALKKGIDAMLRHFHLFYPSGSWLSPISTYFALIIMLIGFVTCGLCILHKFRGKHIERGLRERTFTSTKRSKGIDLGLFSQFALASVVTLIALFITINMIRIMKQDFGFEVENRYVMDVAFPSWKFEANSDLKKNTAKQIKERFKSFPRVEGVNISLGIPMAYTSSGSYSGNIKLTIDDVKHDLGIDHYGIDTNFLENMEITLIRGRNLEQWDANSPEIEILITRDFAENYFLETDPIGYTYETSFNSDDKRIAKIVGVVDNVLNEVKNQKVEFEDRTPLFYHYEDIKRTNQYYAYMFKLAPKAQVNKSDLRKAVREIDPHVYVHSYKKLEKLIEGPFVRLKAAKNMAFIICVMTILLSVFGVFSFLNYQINMRRKELAIRISLGGNA